MFERSVRQQFLVNRARTPTERMMAVCDLLDVVRAMAPDGPEARERRRRVMVLRQQEKERWRAINRQLLATGRLEPATGV